MHANTLVERLTHLAMAGAATGAVFGVPTAFKLIAHPRNERPPYEMPAEPPADRAIVEHEDGADDSIARGPDGMFYAELRTAAGHQRCLVDTGASALTLSTAAATRLGIDTRIAYSGHLDTAAGRYRAGRARVGDVRVAGQRLGHVSAVLFRGAGMPCLLGQELLARLDRVELSGDELRLR